MVWAFEEQPPVGEKAIAWLLLTTLEVTCFEQASTYLRWYSYRWLIERYHYTLKSGCRLEQLQLETADRLERAFSHLCDCRLAMVAKGEQPLASLVPEKGQKLADRK